MKKKIQTGSKIILCTLPTILYRLAAVDTLLTSARAQYSNNIVSLESRQADPCFRIFIIVHIRRFLFYFSISLSYRICTIYTYKYIYAYATNAGMTQAAVYVEKNAISHARTNFVLNAPTLLFVANSSPPFVNRVMVTVLYATQSMQTDSTIVVARSCSVFKHCYIIILTYCRVSRGPIFQTIEKVLFR